MILEIDEESHAGNTHLETTRIDQPKIAENLAANAGSKINVAKRFLEHANWCEMAWKLVDSGGHFSDDLKQMKVGDGTKMAADNLRKLMSARLQKSLKDKVSPFKINH